MTESERINEHLMRQIDGTIWGFIYHNFTTLLLVGILITLIVIATKKSKTPARKI